MQRAQTKDEWLRERLKGLGKNLSPNPIVRQSSNTSQPLSFAQQRLWFLDQWEPGNTAYLLPYAWRLQGLLNREALIASLTHLVARHETLRTCFELQEGQPIQIIAPPAPVPVPLVDLSGQPTEARLAACDRYIQEEASRPFDLQAGHLLRAQLLALGPEEHVFLLTLHHIITDGWSMGILWKELSVLYAAAVRGETATLAPLPVQYADFAVWQRQWLQGERLDKQVQYWEQQLACLPPTLELPTEGPRPVRQTYRGASQAFSLDPGAVDRLTALGQAEGATLFMTLLAAFKVLVARYTGQTDIAVGSPIANRTQTEIEGLIGFFVNTLVLRTQITDHLSFRHLLRQVRETCLEAYAHQDVPFEKLVEVLQPERDPSRHPLIQTMFQVRHAEATNGLSLFNLEVTPVHAKQLKVKFDIEAHVVQYGQALKGQVVFNADLFTPATMAQFTRHYQYVLEELTKHPDKPVSHFSFLTAGEYQQVVKDWNATKKTNAEDVGLLELFQEQVLSRPDSIAVVSGDMQLCYRDLDSRANRLGHFLQSVGVGREIKVGLCLERTHNALIGLLGILKAGGAYVPLDTRYPHDRLNFMMIDSSMDILLTEAVLAKDLPDFKGQLLCLEDVWADPWEPQDDISFETEPSAGDLAYLIYTSGSSGLPKGVEITHGALANFLLSMAESLRLETSDRVLAVTTLSFDISALELFLPLTIGASVVIASHEITSDGIQLATYLSKVDATVMQATPSSWCMLFESGWTGKANLKILSGGEVLSGMLADSLLDSNQELWNLYGPTETTIWSTVYRIQGNDVVIPIGRPIMNTEVYILNNSFQPVPVGVKGELFIGGAGVARGYLDRADLTSQRFICDPFSERVGARLYRTGDLARYRYDGMIEVFGRLDQQVKLRGHRIELGEIEVVLGQLPKVKEAAVVLSDTAALNDIMGARLVAYVVPHDDASVSAEELRTEMRQKFPDYMVPSFFVFIDAMPRTANEKIDRRALPPVTDIETDTETTDDEAMQTPIEQALIKIWTEVLGLTRVGIHDNFFDIGGHSLLAVRLFARIKDELGVRLPLAILVKSATVSQMAKEVIGNRVDSEWSCLVPIQEKGVRPALYCIHGEGGEALFYRGLAKYLGDDQPLFGLQAYGLDGTHPPDTSVEAMAERYIHEIQQRQPTGPYYLAGHCFGGVVAFEMAKQLQAQGQEIGLLAMLDGAGPPVSRTLSESLGNFIRAGVRNPQGLVKYVVQVEVPVRMRYLLRRTRQKFPSKLDEVQPEKNEIELVLETIGKAIATAYRNYEPRMYDGKIVCFINSQRGLLDFNRWACFASGGAETIQFVGVPQTSLMEPSIRYLAKELRQYMDKLIS